MQKGLILYMGYYGRYTAAYSIGCLLMLSLYIAGIFLHWAAFGVLLVLTLAGVMLLAVICSVLGTLQCGVPALSYELRRRGVSGRDTRVPTLAEPQHAAQPGIE